ERGDEAVLAENRLEERNRADAIRRRLDRDVRRLDLERLQAAGQLRLLGRLGPDDEDPVGAENGRDRNGERENGVNHAPASLSDLDLVLEELGAHREAGDGELLRTLRTDAGRPEHALHPAVRR